jgi:Rad3-related DNA helicase
MRNLEDVFKYIEAMCDKKEIKKIKFINPKEKLLSDLGVIFDYCFSYIHSKVSDKSNYKVALLKEDFFGELELETLSKKIESNFLSIIDFLSTTEEYDFSREILSLKAYLDLIKIILDKKGDKEYIRILTFNDNQGVILEYTLLNPGDYLQMNLWDKIHSVTLTSATLKI